MQATDRVMQKMIGILFPILGVVLLLGASIEALMTHRFITLASRAEGEVVWLNAGGVTQSSSWHQSEKLSRYASVVGQS
jgi:hypothetical protein